MTLNGPHAAAGLCGGWPPPRPCRNLTPRLMKRVLASTLISLIRGLDNGVNHNRIMQISANDALHMIKEGLSDYGYPSPFHFPFAEKMSAITNYLVSLGDEL